jgi:hypothetical protein
MTKVSVEPLLIRWAHEHAVQTAESLWRRSLKLAAWATGAAQPMLKQLKAFAYALHVALAVD